MTELVPGRGVHRRGHRPPAVPTLDGYARALGRHLQYGWGASNRFWPGADLGRLSVLLVHGAHARLVSCTGISEVSAAEVCGPGLPGTCVAAYWRGKPVLLLDLAPDFTGRPFADQLLDGFRQATEVGFRQQVQARWPPRTARPEPAGRRPAGAALIRSMIYDALVRAFRDPLQRDRQLRIAAYWYDRWLTRCAGEVTAVRELDLVHGTADYVADAILARVRASADPARARHYLARVSHGRRSDRLTGLERECGALGSIACLNAAELDLDFVAPAESGTATPLDVLLAGSPRTGPARGCVPGELAARPNRRAAR
ncbi:MULTISPECIES: hypothetical protein [unclassified Crossiella]|uniref:hypothetical protein n=1 Tax=unclassified Crossiella TaxID=2620835 RepID=UPI001FFFA35C|nr:MULTISPECIES: hypothetical protein [unclassified Crossiella]MCK2239187.1 hypothetical protein [Crossiella sp. S99.2]MCK2251244.1 hypothetical protein [Crossiella sp. S99.1]